MSVNCHICGSTRLRYLFTGPFEKFARVQGLSSGVDYHYCSDCTGLSQHPIFSSEDYAAFYKSKQRSKDVGYDSARVPEAHLKKKCADAIFKINQMNLMNLFSLVPGKQVLEIGCAEGTLLKALEKMSFVVRGIEPLNLYSEYAKEAFGLNVRTDFFKPDLEPVSSADLVIIDNVLEHCLNPAIVIQEVKKVLTKKGVVYIGVPAADLVRAPDANVAHITLWTRAALASILSKNGFQVISIIKGRPANKPHEWVCIAVPGRQEAIAYEKPSFEDLQIAWKSEISEYQNRQLIVQSRRSRLGPLYEPLRYVYGLIYGRIRKKYRD